MRATLNNPLWRRMKAYFTAAPAQSTPRLFLGCRAPPSPSPARASAGQRRPPSLPAYGQIRETLHSLCRQAVPSTCKVGCDAHPAPAPTASATSAQLEQANRLQLELLVE